MFNELVDWLETVIHGYEFSRGMWVDHAAINDMFIYAVQASGGPAIDVDDRRPRYRVILLGPRNGRHHAEKVQADAELIQVATMTSDPPCGAAAIRAMTEPTGPGYTAENRAFMQIDLQITY